MNRNNDEFADALEAAREAADTTRREFANPRRGAAVAFGDQMLALLREHLQDLGVDLDNPDDRGVLLAVVLAVGVSRLHVHPTPPDGVLLGAIAVLVMDREDSRPSPEPPGV